MTVWYLYLDSLYVYEVLNITDILGSIPSTPTVNESRMKIHDGVLRPGTQRSDTKNNIKVNSVILQTVIML